MAARGCRWRIAVGVCTRSGRGRSGVGRPALGLRGDEVRLRWDESILLLDRVGGVVSHGS